VFGDCPTIVSCATETKATAIVTILPDSDFVWVEDLPEDEGEVPEDYTTAPVDDEIQAELEAEWEKDLGDEAVTGTETTAESTTAVETTSTEIQTTEKTETTTTGSDATFPTSTPSTLLTTTRASSDTATTEISTSDAATTTTEARTYYPCNYYGGPHVADPYCQCVTTVDGKQYVATAPLIDKECEAYTEYPSKVIPVTEPPKPEEPIQTPFTTTNDGTVLVYTAYTTSTMKGFGTTATATIGYGDPSTVSTPLPTQTAVDNDGNGQCGTADKLSKDGLGDACDRAINDFDADTVYTGYTTRYSRSQKGILMTASLGHAACIAKFECDDYGIGMKGSDIIAAYVEPLPYLESDTNYFYAIVERKPRRTMGFGCVDIFVFRILVVL
jgi:hypothetical protein